MIINFRSIKKITSHPLTKNQKIRTIIRYFIFNIRHRISNKYKIYKLLGDVKFYAKIGLPGIVGNIYTGLYDFEDMSFLLHFLSSEDTFFDVGANVGVYTLLASGFSNSKSISIEPIPDTYKLLSENISLNKINSKVKLLNFGVGSKSSLLKFSTNTSAMNRVILDSEDIKDFIDVEVRTIDSLLVNESPILMKMDIEGFEQDALYGATNLLKSDTLKAIIIELNGSGEKYGYKDLDTHKLLLEFGFKPYKYRPFIRKLELVEDFNLDKYNTLYLRDLDFINKRLISRPKINILGYSY